jgi:hypothetical protein
MRRAAGPGPLAAPTQGLGKATPRRGTRTRQGGVRGHRILLMPAHLRRVDNRPRLSLPASGPRQAAWKYALHQIKALKL